MVDPDKVEVGEVLYEISVTPSMIRGCSGTKDSRPIYVLEIDSDRSMFKIGWNGHTQIRWYTRAKVSRLQRKPYEPRRPKK